MYPHLGLSFVEHMIVLGHWLILLILTVSYRDTYNFLVRLLGKWCENWNNFTMALYTQTAHCRISQQFGSVCLSCSPSFFSLVFIPFYSAATGEKTAGFFFHNWGRNVTCEVSEVVSKSFFLMKKNMQLPYCTCAIVSNKHLPFKSSWFIFLNQRENSETGANFNK